MQATHARDLYAVISDEISEFSRSEHNKFVHQLPFTMLVAAAASNPDLRKNSEFSRLEAAFAGEGTPHWRNPELYPHLMAMQIPIRSALQSVQALMVHLGYALPKFQNNGMPHFLRLRGREPRVLQVDESRIVELPDVVFPLVPGGDLLIYCPYPNLFTDIAKGLYRAVEVLGLQSRLRLSLQGALSEIQSYSPNLAAGISEFVKTVAFTSDDLAVTRSYSMRLSYLGGIFSAVCDPPSLTENIIHEYYHIRIRIWWLIERPADLPSDKLKIRSPVTGMERPVSVMIQALLIYVSLIDFYRWRRNTQSELASSTTVEKRLQQLIDGTISLIDLLHSSLDDRPECRRIVALIADIFNGGRVFSKEAMD